ncbi:hypothetical protein Tco_0216505, partial [Tanacetum coccineum]
ELTKYLLALLAISPFHDDLYMKVIQAYNTINNESRIPLLQAPIAPPTVLPPSPVLPLSPMFDPRDFFLPEEILPPQKRARFLSSSSTDFSSPPHVFEIGENSHKTHLEHHEEQIETILNHLDELPLERIEHLEDKIEGLDELLLEHIEHMEDKIEGLGKGRREQIRHDDEIILAHVRISTLEMIIVDIQVIDVSYLYVSRITMVLLPSGFLEPLCPGITDMINNQDIEHMIPPTPPPDYPFDKSIFAELG